ncbi:MAG: hypothetical protein DDT34_01641 [Firmicutes bacterium]|nr:hypothetical protein [Bacillota bacterium]
MPDRQPSPNLILINLAITVLLFLIAWLAKKVARPIVIYAIMGLFVHLVSVLYFLFFAPYFPYTLTDYSELYLKQQVGIWLSFIVLSTIVSGLISTAGVSKYLVVLAIMGYSFVFGILRYIAFLAILSWGSSLYMAVLLFIFGPFFDFVYFVSFYSIYINYLIIKIDDPAKGVHWQWS